MKINTISELKAKINECVLSQTTAKRTLSFCCSSGCVANKSLNVKAAFETLIKEHNLEEQIETKPVGCFGYCSQGPFVKVYPDNVTYKLVKENMIESPTEIDDHDIHLNQHISFLLGNDFEKLGNSKQKEIMINHIREHKKLRGE